MDKDTLDYATISFQIPLTLEADVIVVGGGPAGLAAAIASARQGARTALIEGQGCVGGMATTGLVGPFMTSFDTAGSEQIVRGVFDELVRRMVAEGGAIHPSDVTAPSDYTSFIREAHNNVTPFDSEAMKFVAMEMLLEAGATVKLHTRLVRVLNRDEAIDGLVLADKSGLCLARGGTYVDTTGDGDVAAFAGNPFEKGRVPDGRLQPATLFMRIGNVDDDRVCRWMREESRQGERLFATQIKRAREEGNFPADLPRESVGLYKQPRKGEWRVNTSRILGIDGTDPDSLTKAEIAGRRQAAGLMKFFRAYCPGLEQACLIETASRIGIRETRRIEGLYRLTKEDVAEGRAFDDAIARYSFFMDIHNPTGSGQETVQRLFITGGRYFEIPYRCLVPSRVRNLLVAGRCLSADHHANGAVRVMPACFATGQAAGTAAALCVADECLPGGLDVEKLRSTLRRNDCVV